MSYFMNSEPGEFYSELAKVYREISDWPDNLFLLRVMVNLRDFFIRDSKVCFRFLRERGIMTVYHLRDFFIMHVKFDSIATIVIVAISVFNIFGIADQFCVMFWQLVIQSLVATNDFLF